MVGIKLKHPFKVVGILRSMRKELRWTRAELNDTAGITDVKPEDCALTDGSDYQDRVVRCMWAMRANPNSVLFDRGPAFLGREVGEGDPKLSAAKTQSARKK
ncbi:MAG: hypothetical protein AAF661_05185 [Pseudomonadota bacterium]